jgi:hypothetical protein
MEIPKEILEFIVAIVGHDEETILQMWKDWNHE